MKKGFMVEILQIKMHIPTQNWIIDIFLNGNTTHLHCEYVEAQNLIRDIHMANLTISNDMSYIYYVPNPQ